MTNNFKPIKDYEAIVKLSDGFSGADLRNVCTEAGLLQVYEFTSFLLSISFIFG
jgi:26S proteasome regulatory subunit T4